MEASIKLNKENKMEDFELTKKPDMDIFDRRFPTIFDDPIYDPTKMTIIQGTDGVLDDLFSYQVYNKLKNNWRGAVAPTDMQDGMIYSDTDDGKLHHRHGAALEEVLQLTRSSDVTPTFLGLLLAEYITHVGDPDTYIRFQPDIMTLRVGGIDFINMVEAGTDYLQLLAGKNFIGDNLNANMAQGLTIQQAGYDDEILAFKSSDVAHGITDHTETDTYALFKKQDGAKGGLWIQAFGEVSYGIYITGVATTDNTDKDGTALAPVILDARKKSGTGWGVMGADANLVAMRNSGSTKWLLDEDGDTWQPGDVNCDGEVNCASLARLVLGTPTELTVDGAGAITVTRGYHTVDGAGDADDNLDTINGGVAGMILVLQAEHNLRTITLRDGQDNIELEGGANFALATIAHKIYLFYDPVTTNWNEISRFTP